jgi:hypothetical protein
LARIASVAAISVKNRNIVIMDQRALSFMKINFVGKSLWFMQNNNGVKQRFLDCFLKILDKKRKKWRELLPDQ